MDGSMQFESFQLRKKSYPTAPKGKTILVTGKRKTVSSKLNILHEEKDVTPKPLNPDIFTAGRERQLSVYDIGLDRLEKVDHKPSASLSLNVFKTQSTVRFRTDLDKITAIASLQYKGSISVDTSLLDTNQLETLSSDDRSGETFRTEGSEEETVLEMKKPPTHISLTLSETNTFFLLDIPSSTVEQDTEEGNLVEEENRQYEYLTEGKGRHRKVFHTEVQTLPVTMKTRHTLCRRIKTKTDTAFVSNWDMYDTYQQQGEVRSCEEDNIEEDINVGHQLEEIPSVDFYRTSSDEKQLIKLIKNPRFLEAVCVIERLLANNCYNEQQKIFRGLTVQNDFRENIEYNYKLNLLWTFANNSTKGKSVNSIHWNPGNKDIVAVGYGKFYFADKIPGLVLIWNIKNPVQPERSYSFKESVTSVSFSSSNPILLAVGFYLGSVVVLNIVSREKMIIGENTPTFEPAWDVSWQYGRNEKKHEEIVVGTFDDGRICSYSVQRKLETSHLMRVATADGKLKGYDVMRKCSNVTIPVSRYASALFNRPHPYNTSIYFVGTDEGVIHKCSLNYLNRHLDLFLAHDGPIHEMKFSPFSTKVIATCGDDWHTRLWIEGISEPVLGFFVTMQSIQGLDWSPSHSTILVDIRGSHIQIWDIQRKVYEPQSITVSPTGSRNTVVQFTDSGRSLLVGDIDGNVHVFSLEDMPFPAFFQENLLFESLSRALITYPEMLKKIKN